MGIENKRDDLFMSSHMNVLVSCTIFGVILLVESFLMEWEVWPLILISVGIIGSWGLHLGRIGTNVIRIWLYAGLMMGGFFFYGTHLTSTFDLAPVITAIIIIYILTRIKGLVTLAQVTYCVTMAYSLTAMFFGGYEFDVLTISRILLHIVLVFMISALARTVIDRWNEVLNQSEEEIEELKDSTERLNDFLANVSHELRTPVNAVVGLSGICIDKEPNDEIRADMMAIRSAGHRVAAQISDILDYSEIDKGNLVQNAEDFMISSLMNDLVTELREYKPRELELVINIDPAIPAVMNTDVSKLKKIIKALVSNGLKYTEEGGVYVGLKAENHEYGVNLCIEVTDTGIGMTPEERERVFERYYQADSGRSRRGGGLGLGLGIVAGFVGLLGGFMTIDSEVDKGTKVRVSLPMKVVDDSSCTSVTGPEDLSIAAYLHFDKFPNPYVREFYNASVFNIVKGLGVTMHRVDNAENLKKLCDSVSLTHLFVGEDEFLQDTEIFREYAKEMVVVVVAEPGFTLPAGIRAKVMEKPFYCFPIVSILNTPVDGRELINEKMMVKGARVLVVDDEPMNLVVGKSIFKRYGMTVYTANSGQESVEICREKVFDAIFMDHMMAGMDGVEAMKRIRADVSGLNRNTPMVALTANAMSSAKQMFQAEGFDGFVSKPIEVEELERTIKNILPKHMISYVPLEELKESAVSFVNSGENDTKTSESAPAEIKEKETNSGIKDAAPAEAGNAKDSEEGSFSGKLRAAGIDIETALGYCAGDVEFYRVLLHQFASETKEKTARMNGFLQNEDWKNYEIIIHAVKSTSKMIGGLNLSEHALNLEKAAKENNAEYITSNHEKVMKEYDALYRAILDALGEKEDGAPAVEEEAFEFAPSAEGNQNNDEVLEFAPAAEDEILEFNPVTEES